MRMFSKNYSQRRQNMTFWSQMKWQSPFLKTCHNYYEFGDKPSKLLAHKIRSPSHQGTLTRLTQILEQLLTPKPSTTSSESFMLHYYPQCPNSKNPLRTLF
ncbi:hypothetical protein FQN60_007949 [Etheostoma spectabile]|uniref:Uncharacterized protein n=1 Tax=Etheostoma spectabile TaxID=54343 RepID=A0A5J5CS84_9PERO|nr:hypothetical protein FQN60_007949 [Etheostoma spectabile]